MNMRAQLLAVLNNEKPQITPWFGDLSYWLNAQSSMGKLDNKYKGKEGYLKFHIDTGVGIYLYPPAPWKTEYKGGIQTKVEKRNSKIITKHITPLGEVKQTANFLQKSQCMAITEYFVKTIEDLKLMRYIRENTVYIPSYKELIKTDKMWNGYGMPMVTAPAGVSPIQRLLARWAGVEKTIDLMMSHPNEFDSTIQDLEKYDDKAFEIIVNCPNLLTIFPENLSSEITGTKFYNEYSHSYYAQRLKQLHAAGKKVAIHIDGSLSGVFPLLGETGFDIAEAVTPAPVGDVEVDNLRSVAGEEIVIWGGIPGSMFSPVCKEKDFINHIKKLLWNFPLGSNFVLGVADQVPPDANIKRICLVRELVEKYSQ